jgi:hypothetical protein
MALAQILLRGGTSAEWAASNPVLAERELAIDTTLKRVKVGDGQNAWSALPWVMIDAADVARLEAAADALVGAADVTDAAMTTVQADPTSAFAVAQEARFGAGGTAGNINKSTAQGVALVQALIFGGN